jgi:CheY-like chemotaxis protein
MDGFEVARRLRRQPGTEQALLVAVTAYGGEEDRKEGLDAGFDHYFVKPVDPNDLRRLLYLKCTGGLPFERLQGRGSG